MSKRTVRQHNILRVENDILKILFRKRREKWTSFVKSHKLSTKSSQLCMSSLSVKQYSKLKKFALVRITALMDKHSLVSQKSSWDVFKYEKRLKRENKS